MKKAFSTKLLGGVATTLAAIGFLTGSVSAEDLTVYTAVEAEDLKRYAAAFNEVHPDITVNWVRDSTGVVTAKLLAEKDNPQADVVWGLAGSSLLLMKKEDMFETYAPAGVDQLDSRFRDNSDTPVWAGMDAWVAAVCVNTVEAEANNLPMPTSWADLTKPEYKGHVAMPNPGSSGTGFLDVASWLQMFGEEDGWAFMDDLHENISHYTHSGSKPCKQAAAGEVSIGISFAFRAAKSKNQGAPLEIVMPSEGVGWEMEAAAIVKGTKKLDAAKKLMDFIVSKPAMEHYNQGYAVVAMPGISKPIENYPANITDSMIAMDFEWSANNRDAILAEWTDRYDSKSEPKN
ncbi:putative 2-aminoethylphosphonate ABC transporter substrate-binding protein [Kiloniella sp.]|uniref:putative 2-aminoethylphosphonate ABC transporter substrate-binding protein n=1 Tax=Kiloniella sp. TaxID=1938587 RepID=UPI003A8CEC1B